MSEKIFRFLAEQRPDLPCLVVDLDVVAGKYRALAALLPGVGIYYAVKANPAPEVLSVLAGLGAGFDAASVTEIRSALDAGGRPERISYGSTIKKRSEIAAAYALGVRLFAFDSQAELEKIAEAAPGSRVCCRIRVSESGADWPLTRKFGCDFDMACDLMRRAGGLGVDPYGMMFHVGSQQTKPEQWDAAIEKSKQFFDRLRADGITLKMLNLGGGLPAHYRTEVPPIERYTQEMQESLARHFPEGLPELLIEPGRYIVAEAGIIQSEVVLIAKKSAKDEVRWVYLDVGKFSGLAETMDEAIEYVIRTPHDGGPAGPVILAGPTCDGVDVLYEKAGYKLPLDLAIGDRVEIFAAGAYTTTYSTVGFNGLPPLKDYYI
ncbi:MAG: type III PLP-dependent enzyme [Alphaproteobacteria bacterium]|nr:type III PLP-dependent enzyme [Alphaproteobacteria bacterium]